MLPKNCGQLLFNAVRETLETMAFAEVVPCSIKVGDEEFSPGDDGGLVEITQGEPTGGGEVGWGDVPAAATPDAWGTPVGTDDSWGAPSSETLPVDSWGTTSPEMPAAGDSWGDPAPLPPVDDDGWGESGIIKPSSDPWGESAAMAASIDPVPDMAPKEADFDEMVKEKNASDEWCWACMKVNSPDIHSVWFIVTKGLANALAMNMYAGEDFQLDNPLIRDLIAELTNVLGGRLMLLLEEMGGKFTLTVPDIGFGLPDVPQQGFENAICKVVVDGEHPVITALCFNPGGITAI